MIDLDSFRKFSECSNFETLSWNFLQLMKSIYGPVPIDLVNFEPSIINDNSPRLNIFSMLILLYIRYRRVYFV